jgi:hypothetical protein
MATVTPFPTMGPLRDLSRDHRTSQFTLGRLQLETSPYRNQLTYRLAAKEQALVRGMRTWINSEK